MAPHHSILTRTRVQAVCDYLDHRGIQYSHSDVFQWAGVKTRTGWRFLQLDRSLGDPRTHHKNHPDPRGRKRRFTPDDIQKMKSVVEKDGWDGTWDELPAAAGLDIQASRETIRRAMKSVGFSLAHKNAPRDRPDRSQLSQQGAASSQPTPRRGERPVGRARDGAARKGQSATANHNVSERVAPQAQGLLAEPVSQSVDKCFENAAWPLQPGEQGRWSR